VPRSGGTAYERIGGASAVLTVVERLYDRALADPALAPYFHDTRMSLQRDKLVGMLTEALGGPRSPWLAGMVQAHRGRGITHAHFDRMASYLFDVLQELEVEQGEVRQVARWLSTSRAAVVDDTSA
jgi:hemoglobin